MPRQSHARKVASIDQTRIEEAIAGLARQQHRQVRTAQLLAIGLGPGAIKARSRNGRLHRVHQGVYSIGSPPASDLERASAALLACGPEAALYGPTALAIWDMAKFPFMSRIAVPSDRRHPQIAIHRLSEPLHPADVRLRHGLRATAPARTLLDAAARKTPRQLTRLVDDALRIPRLRLTRPELQAVIDRYPRHPGAENLRRHAETDRNASRSELEVDFVEFCVRFALPEPTFNHPVQGHEADVYFPAERVVVECDGWDFHNSRAAFESDRDRDTERLAADIPTVRVTKRRLKGAAQREAERLHAILARRRGEAEAA